MQELTGTAAAIVSDTVKEAPSAPRLLSPDDMHHMLQTFMAGSQVIREATSSALGDRPLFSLMSGCNAIISLANPTGMAHIPLRAFPTEGNLDGFLIVEAIAPIKTMLVRGPAIILASVFEESTMNAKRLRFFLSQFGIPEEKLFIVDPFQWISREVSGSHVGMYVKLTRQRLEILFASGRFSLHYGSAIFEKGVWRYVPATDQRSA